MAEQTRDLIDRGMRVVTTDPLNVETSLGTHAGVITPTPLFYHRNHFPFPDMSHRRIEVSGAVERPQELQDVHVLSMPRRTSLVTMECAGNGRSGMRPQAEGEPWDWAAVSTAEWTGISLRDILERTGVKPGVVEILVEGADRGHVDAAGGTIPFARSVPLAKAMDPDVILAFAMNGEGINRAHGGPYRLIVPGWYGMASVKWVRRIEALTEPFRGFYQVDRYVMPDRAGGTTPLGAMRVRSVIAASQDESALVTGFPSHMTIRGMAWSGEAPIIRVEVSVDGGFTWQEARLFSREERYAWRRWDWIWEITEPGDFTLVSRAFDASGNTQPVEAEWNRLGYANNAIHAVRVKVALQP